MNRSLCLISGALLGMMSQTGLAADTPNVLIIMADDCTHNDLPVYGGQNARTPNIDQLARQGLTFNRAYLGEAMCQPCRAELYTGQYPMRNGCAWNHSASRPTTTSIPHHLGQLGYRVGLAGKVHVQPPKAFPFEKVGGFDTNCVRNPTQPHDLGPIGQFMTRDNRQPFCLVVALVEPHVPWVMGDPSQYPPQQLKLPPNIADTPRTRADFARYLAEITYMDGQVGEILGELDDAGLADETLVLFTSEQGSQFPGCKWTNWDTGLHTALIARWPGRVASGQRSDALVQYADVAPTLVDAAKGDVSEQAYDGTSFLPVLLGQESKHRQYVYGVHNNIPEGPPYPIRTVCDGQYRYIRNLSPGELYIEKHLMGRSGDGALNNPYWATWVWDSWNNPHTYKLVKRYMHRPAEQLYHTAEDPYEMTNLADEAAHADRKERLGDELDRWMTEQGDPGAAQDTQEAIRAARQGKHLYGPRELGQTTGAAPDGVWLLRYRHGLLTLVQGENILGHADTKRLGTQVAGVSWVQKGGKSTCERMVLTGEPSRELTPQEQELLKNASRLNEEAKKLLGQQKADDALVKMKEASQLYVEVHGEDHHDSANSFSNLATILGAMGNRDEAGPFWAKALTIHEKKLGTNHPHTTLTRFNRGKHFLEAGDKAKAKELWTQCRDDWKAVLGPDYPLVATLDSILQRL